jgi:hypothetical protein
LIEGLIMAVKILIQRKIKPGKEDELAEAIREIRSKAMNAQGFISGDPAVCGRPFCPPVSLAPGKALKTGIVG